MEHVFRALLQGSHSPAACSLSVGAGEKSTHVLSLLNPALFQFSSIIAVVVGNAQFLAAKQAFPASLKNRAEERKLDRQKGPSRPPAPLSSDLTCLLTHRRGTF